jgi:hypothetical protein
VHFLACLTASLLFCPQLERSLEVEFTDEEQKEYTALDDATCDFYMNDKANKGKELSRYCLLLSLNTVVATGGHDLEYEDDLLYSSELSA